MVRARQIPSGEGFVVKVEPSAISDVRRSLAGLGTVENLAGSDLLLLRVPDATSDPRSAWQRILDQVRLAQWVAPLLLDEGSHPHYPTGDVTVRFDHVPSDTALEQFAAAHGLRVRARNEFVSEQVSFTLAAPRGTYLPDLLQAIGGGTGVAAAWANTLSRYRRTHGGR